MARVLRPVRAPGALADGHPDFSGFPLSAERVGASTRARTRLAFDHSKHLTLHFPEKKADFQCVACHVLDGDGRNLGVVESESSCGSCHFEDVISGQLVLLALPNLDSRKLDVVDSGSWPRTSRKKRPVELLHLLLLGDPELDPGLAEALRSGEINDSNDLSRRSRLRRVSAGNRRGPPSLTPAGWSETPAGPRNRNRANRRNKPLHFRVPVPIRPAIPRCASPH